jgi:hypothetical protein
MEYGAVDRPVQAVVSRLALAAASRLVLAVGSRPVPEAGSRLALAVGCRLVPEAGSQLALAVGCRPAQAVVFQRRPAVACQPLPVSKMVGLLVQEWLLTATLWRHPRASAPGKGGAEANIIFQVFAINLA